MARPSKIDRLPAAIRDQIELLREAGHTIDEILAHLRSLGVDDVSRSGLGKHIQEIDVIGERIRRSRAMARILGAQGDDALARANVELLHDALFRLQTAAEGGASDQMTPLDLQRLSAMVRNLMTTARGMIELGRSRQDWEREQREKLDAVVAEIGATAPDARPDPMAVLKRIREDIYGITP